MKRHTSAKKLLSLLLAAALLFSCALPGFAVIQFPVDIEGTLNDYPVIIVPGISTAWLCCDDGTERGVCAWDGMNINRLLPLLLNRIGELTLGLTTLPFDKADRIAATIAGEMKNAWPYLGCNPDGSSIYPVHVYATDAASTNVPAIDDTYNVYEAETENAATIAKYIGEEKIYNFLVDWRMGAEYCANRLRDYIASVKAHSGKDKVNIFAVSHGGQITATYLALYGDEGDVYNAVLSSPAIGGAGIACDLLARRVRVDEQTLLKMIEVGFFVEEDYEWLLKAVDLGFVDKILNALVPYLANSMGYWGGLWDLVPTGQYELLKRRYLSDPACAPLIAQSDRFHYEILPAMAEKLRALNENGTHIAIITGSGNRIVSGMNVYSDGIIPVACATGATCAPYGQRFADGYIQKDPWGGKNKLSPNMQIDASTAFLPDRTWFSDGNYHGWTYWSPCTRTLALQLLLTDEIEDVYSDPRYPQFLTSDHISYGVDFNFTSDVPGYLSADCGSVTVKNVCDEATVRITGVYCKEAPIAFRVAGLKPLAPGESVTIPFSGSLPAGSRTCLHLTVCYTMNNATPFSFRTKGFTIEGARKENAPGGTTLINAYPFTNVSNRLLSQAGLLDYVALFYMQLLSIFRAFRAMLPAR